MQLEALFIFKLLLCFAIFLQTLEYLKIKKEFSQNGIWASTNETQNKLFVLHLKLRPIILLGVLYPPTSVLSLVYLIFSQILICLRVGFPFSGGAEGVLFYSQLCLLLYKFYLQLWPLYFLGILILSSYTLAGLKKVFSAEWRNGHALNGFLSDSWYSIPNTIKTNSSEISKTALPFIIIQFLLPLSLILPNGFWIFATLGSAFHLSVFYIFGLNRFFWVWVANYPVIYLFTIN